VRVIVYDLFMKKKIIVIFVSVALVLIGKYIYDVNFNYNFHVISKGKVFRSGVIPPDELKNYVEDYNIKSVIDLRFPGTKDSINNPEVPLELIAEKTAIEKLKGVQYFNVGSDQVPDSTTISNFLSIMDNKVNYPVLIHCYHGVGRSPLFSAIYRMEYEGISNEEARDETRFLLKWSSFDNGKPKGEFLKHYQKREKHID
jgi:protein tyrosine/serine phosphatase